MDKKWNISLKIKTLSKRQRQRQRHVRRHVGKDKRKKKQFSTLYGRKIISLTPKESQIVWNCMTQHT